MSHPNSAERARAIRDFILPFVRENGKLQRIGTISVLDWETTDWRFMHRTPFTKWPSLDAPTDNYLEALIQQSLEPILPYGLDVWRGPKVMSIEWSDDAFNIISFHSGSWEAELLNIVVHPT